MGSISPVVLNAESYANDLKKRLRFLMTQKVIIKNGIKEFEQKTGMSKRVIVRMVRASLFVRNGMNICVLPRLK